MQKLLSRSAFLLKSFLFFTFIEYFEGQTMPTIAVMGYT